VLNKKSFRIGKLTYSIQVNHQLQCIMAQYYELCILYIYIIDSDRKLADSRIFDENMQ